jgi:hypothetical protein
MFDGIFDDSRLIAVSVALLILVASILLKADIEKVYWKISKRPSSTASK